MLLRPPTEEFRSTQAPKARLESSYRVELVSDHWILLSSFAEGVVIGSDDPGGGTADPLSGLERDDLVWREHVLDSEMLHQSDGYLVYDPPYEQALEASNEVFGRCGNRHLVGCDAEFRQIDVDESYASAVAVVRRLTAERRDRPARHLEALRPR